MTIDQAHDLIYNEKEGLGLCGCGDTLQAIKLVKLVLLIQHRKRSIDSKTEDHSARYNYYESKLKKLLPNTGVYYLVLYSLDNKGFTAHGGMVDNAWLTEKGKGFLDCLLRHGTRAVLDND